MENLLQARTSMNRGEATGLDRVVPEMIKALLWKALRVITQTFESRYMGSDTQPVESWLKNIIILKTWKTNDTEQARGIRLQSALAKWYCGCVSNMLQTCLSTNLR